jgi:asparagine synthetase B (glutamine-hydrolysing)
VFEPFNRAVAERARALGGRVLLNGVGGDELFGVADWYMADLLRGGRFLRLRRYAKARGYSGARAFIHHSLRPALPFALFDLLEVPLQRRVCSRLYEMPTAGWIVADGGMLDDIILGDRRDFAESWVRPNPTVTARNRAWCVGSAAHAQNYRCLFDYHRHQGVELRLPFYDRRLVELSLSRHPEELNQPGRWKVMLDKAISGRLPDRTRAFQAGGRKPGTMVGLMSSRWGPETLEFVLRLSDRPWRLEELGLVDSGRFRRALGDGRMDLSSISIADVSLTVLAEVWLRAQESH